MEGSKLTNGMESTEQLAGRLREVLLNGNWIANTNYQDQLSGLSFQQVTRKIGSVNTIAALTFHINYYLAGILNVLDGGMLDIRDKFSFDLPPLKAQKDWDDLLNEFFSNAEDFCQKVELLPEGKLEEIFVDPAYGSYRRNIEGVIEHSYYHLGQISLLRKMIEESEK